MLASDDANPEFVNPVNPDQRLNVEIYSKPVPNNYETEKQGRPIFYDRVYIRIITPGNKDNIIDRPIYDADKRRFPLHWAHYQNTHSSNAVNGTPIDQWPLISASQAEELKAQKFLSVEMIAGASDLQLQSMGMSGGMAPMSLRARAQAYLAAASNSALPESQAQEIEKLRQENMAKDAQHQAEMDDMRKMIADLAANQKGKPGRKKAEV